MKGQWVAAAEVDDCGHVVPLGGKTQQCRAERLTQQQQQQHSAL